MAFAEALSKQVKKPGTRCAIAVVLDAMEPADAEELSDALVDATWAHAQIHRALKAEGHDLAASTVSRHRKGDCACGAA
jgi:hypothetical protein